MTKKYLTSGTGEFDGVQEGATKAEFDTLDTTVQGLGNVAGDVTTAQTTANQGVADAATAQTLADTNAGLIAALQAATGSDHLTSVQWAEATRTMTITDADNNTSTFTIADEFIQLVNDLTSTDTDKALTAAQGKELKDLIDALSSDVIVKTPTGAVQTVTHNNDSKTVISSTSLYMDTRSITSGDSVARVQALGGSGGAYLEARNINQRMTIGMSAGGVGYIWMTDDAGANGKSKIQYHYDGTVVLPTTSIAQITDNKSIVTREYLQQELAASGSGDGDLKADGSVKITGKFQQVLSSAQSVEDNMFVMESDGHFNDDGKDAGLTISSFEPHITFDDKTTGTRPLQIMNEGGQLFIREVNLADSTFQAPIVQIDGNNSTIFDAGNSNGTVVLKSGSPASDNAGLVNLRYIGSDGALIAKLGQQSTGSTGFAINSNYALTMNGKTYMSLSTNNGDINFTPSTGYVDIIGTDTGNANVSLLRFQNHTGVVQAYVGVSSTTSENLSVVSNNANVYVEGQIFVHIKARDNYIILESETTGQVKIRGNNSTTDVAGRSNITFKNKNETLEYGFVGVASDVNNDMYLSAKNTLRLKSNTGHVEIYSDQADKKVVVRNTLLLDSGREEKLVVQSSKNDHTGRGYIRFELANGSNTGYLGMSSAVNSDITLASQVHQLNLVAKTNMSIYTETGSMTLETRGNGKHIHLKPESGQVVIEASNYDNGADDWPTLRIIGRSSTADSIVTLENDTGDNWSMRLDRSDSNMLNFRYNNSSRLYLDTTGRLTLTGDLQRHNGNLGIYATGTGKYVYIKSSTDRVYIEAKTELILRSNGNTNTMQLGVDGVLKALKPDYETKVTHDDHIPNKKYVDDKVAAVPGSNGLLKTGDTATGRITLKSKAADKEVLRLDSTGEIAAYMRFARTDGADGGHLGVFDSVSGMVFYSNNTMNLVGRQDTRLRSDLDNVTIETASAKPIILASGGGDVRVTSTSADGWAQLSINSSGTASEAILQLQSGSDHWRFLTQSRGDNSLTLQKEGASTHIFRSNGGFQCNSINASSSIATGVAYIGESDFGSHTIELASRRTSDGVTFIDFHATVGSDFNARIIRYGGLNSWMEVVNSGAGGIAYKATSHHFYGTIENGHYQGWRPIPLTANQWVVFGGEYGATAWYKKDANGWVHLQGLIKRPGTDNRICIFPQGFRPDATLIFSCLAGGSQSRRVDLHNDGAMYCWEAGIGEYLSLSDISFYAG